MKFSILPNSWLVNSASTGIHCTFNAHAGTHSCYAVIGASIPREDKVWSPGTFTYTIYPSLYPSVYHLYTHVIIPYNISRYDSIQPPKSAAFFKDTIFRCADGTFYSSPNGGHPPEGLAARQKLVFTIRSACATSSSVSGSCAAQRCPNRSWKTCPFHRDSCWFPMGLKQLLEPYETICWWDLVGILDDLGGFSIGGEDYGLFWRLLDSTRIIGRAKESFIIYHTNPQNHRKLQFDAIYLYLIGIVQFSSIFYVFGWPDDYKCDWNVIGFLIGFLHPPSSHLGKYAKKSIAFSAPAMSDEALENDRQHRIPITDICVKKMFMSISYIILYHI